MGDSQKCLALNNFSTMFAVLAGLNSSTILRLKKTWAVSPTVPASLNTVHV
jgi:hypothetical protein